MTTPFSANGNSIILPDNVSIDVPSGQAISAANGGVISGTAVSITSRRTDYGPVIQASGSGSKVIFSGPAIINGYSAGIYMENGGLVSPGNNSTINILGLQNTDAIGIFISNSSLSREVIGTGMTINIDAPPATSHTGPANWTGLYFIGGANNSADINDLTIQGNAADNGAGVKGRGNQLNLTNSNFTINSKVPNISLPSGNAPVYFGIKADSDTILNVSNTNIAVHTPFSAAGIITGKSVVNLANVSVNMTGDGLKSPSGDIGDLAGMWMSQSNVVARGLDIITSGSNAYGTRIGGNQELGCTFIGDNVNITTLGKNSIAFRMGTSDVTLSDSKIDARGEGSLAFYSSANGTMNFSGGSATSTGTLIQIADGANRQFNFTRDAILQTSGGQLMDLKGSGKAAFTASQGVVMKGDIQAYTPGNVSLALLQDSRWQGAARNAGPVTLSGGSLWDMTGNSDIAFLNHERSVIAFSAPAGDVGSKASYRTLTIRGDDISNGGILKMNTFLGSDDSPTDRLIVEGNTAGNTRVEVTNTGGRGAKTVDGIELITVTGKSEGNFTQSRRIVAGAYDYSLVRGSGDAEKNWYLVNYAEPAEPVVPTDPEPPTDPVTPAEPVIPTDPVSPTDSVTPAEPVIPMDPASPTDPAAPAKPVSPTDPIKPTTPVYRPEIASYGANLAAANTLFVLRLHDRLGETQYTDMLTGEKKVTSMWMRNVGGHTRFNDQSGQLSSQANRYVTQLGGDIAQWSNNGRDRMHLGVMAGYGNEHSNTGSHRSHYRSDGAVNGYSAGAYGTWYRNGEDKSGLYIDAWLQYSWFDNRVKGEGIAAERYKSRGFTASVESGYTFSMGTLGGSQGNLTEWYIQPRAQIIPMGVKADAHTESNGSIVTGEGENNIQMRFGVKTYIKGHSKEDEGKQREFQPFIEANWLHNTHEFGASMNGVTNHVAGSRNLGEIKTGVEGMLKPDVNLWGNVAVQAGTDGYSDVSAMIGVKFMFR